MVRSVVWGNVLFSPNLNFSLEAVCYYEATSYVRLEGNIDRIVTPNFCLHFETVSKMYLEWSSGEAYLNSIVISLSVMHNNNPLKCKSLEKMPKCIFLSNLLIWVGLLENVGISGSFKMEKRLIVPTFYNVWIMKYINSAKIALPFANVRQSCTIEPYPAGFLWALK